MKRLQWRWKAANGRGEGREEAGSKEEDANSEASPGTSTSQGASEAESAAVSEAASEEALGERWWVQRSKLTPMVMC